MTPRSFRVPRGVSTVVIGRKPGAIRKVIINLVGPEYPGEADLAISRQSLVSFVRAAIWCRLAVSICKVKAYALLKSWWCSWLRIYVTKIILFIFTNLSFVGTRWILSLVCNPDNNLKSYVCREGIRIDAGPKIYRARIVKYFWLPGVQRCGTKIRYMYNNHKLHILNSINFINWLFKTVFFSYLRASW